MGFKINKFFIIISLCFFVAGCGAPDFDEIERANVFYQVYPGQTDILRIRRKIDEGAPSIQLFDKKGHQLQKITIAPMGIVLITSMKNESIQITYFVGQSDLETFLPWFKTNKFNPIHIGKYSIHYNYEVQNSHSEDKGSEIDSLQINKKTETTSLFLNGHLIATKPTYFFILDPSELQAYDPVTKAYTKYPFANSNLAKGYLRKILNMYGSQ
ncbi:hypothetical protein [Pedobacter sp.]|jgi:hypothetical protein|uniref:hypothetical protein n=1 Tax=Pedobacter sp. TaxID=1411316 RepID=UPI002B813D14|nr:hypothetical protein [Pedobacter sp.]HWW43098.1 hypothetical protein [Pedobacter sp.]